MWRTPSREPGRGSWQVRGRLVVPVVMAAPQHSLITLHPSQCFICCFCRGRPGCRPRYIDAQAAMRKVSASAPDYTSRRSITSRSGAQVPPCTRRPFLLAGYFARRLFCSSAILPVGYFARRPFWIRHVSAVRDQSISAKNGANLCASSQWDRYQKGGKSCASASRLS